MYTFQLNINCIIPICTRKQKSICTTLVPRCVNVSHFHLGLTITYHFSIHVYFLFRPDDNSFFLYEWYYVANCINIQDLMFDSLRSVGITIFIIFGGCFYNFLSYQCSTSHAVDLYFSICCALTSSSNMLQSTITCCFRKCAK